MGTTNQDRIANELRNACTEVDERVVGYGEALITTALDLINETAEHVEARTNINQRFDGRVRELARLLMGADPGGSA